MFEYARLSFHPIPQDEAPWPGYCWYVTGSFSRAVEAKRWYYDCHDEAELILAVAEHLGVEIKDDSESGQIWVYFKSMEDAVRVMEGTEDAITVAMGIKPEDLIGVSL